MAFVVVPVGVDVMQYVEEYTLGAAPHSVMILIDESGAFFPVPIVEGVVHCVEESAVCAALVDESGAFFTDHGEVVVQRVEECAIDAALVDGAGTVVPVPIGESIMQFVEECAVGAALVDEGGAVVLVQLVRELCSLWRSAPWC